MCYFVRSMFPMDFMRAYYMDLNERDSQSYEGGKDDYISRLVSHSSYRIVTLYVQRLWLSHREVASRKRIE